MRSQFLGWPTTAAENLGGSLSEEGRTGHQDSSGLEQSLLNNTKSSSETSLPEASKELTRQPSWKKSKLRCVTVFVSDDPEADAFVSPKPYCPKHKTSSSSGPSWSYTYQIMIWLQSNCVIMVFYVILSCLILRAMMMANDQSAAARHKRVRGREFAGFSEVFVKFGDEYPDSLRNTTRVAIFADAAINEATERVLQLVADENVDMVLHPGDIDYAGDVERWENQMISILGPNFPYFYSAGNYEMKIPKARRNNPEAFAGEQWIEYVHKRDAILNALGVDCPLASPSRSQLACHYKGVSFILSNLSDFENRMEQNSQFVRRALLALKQHYPSTRWTFCMWHAPFHLMQVGFRDPPPVMHSEHLESAYEECRKAGAVVLTGHEHYYLRSHEITSFQQPYAFNKPQLAKEGLPLLHAKPGKTFAIVSGLGGHSVSVPSRDAYLKRSHLAAVHPRHMLSDTDPGGKIFYKDVSGSPETSSEVIHVEKDSSAHKHGYPFGALFCELPVGPQEIGNPAYCYFKTINGEVVDQFLISD